MGCDGGTIPRRDELVKTKKKPEQKDKNSERAFRWKHCTVSQEPLRKPIVACEKGRLYNKESILEHLLKKSSPEQTPNELVAHIRNMKDVKELKLTDNPAYKEEIRGENGDGYIDVQKSRYICPMTSLEMNGTFRFSFIWSCGCVLSERALKEIAKVKSLNSKEEFECLSCQKKFTAADVVILNPVDDEEINLMTARMVTRRSLKKSKKTKTNGISATVTSSSTSMSDSNTGKTEKGTISDSQSKKQNLPQKLDTSTTEKLEVGDGSKKGNLKRNADSERSVQAKISKTTQGNNITDKHSISSDPNASEAYKSLFTSHRLAKNQQKAHWVTFNPFYN